MFCCRSSSGEPEQSRSLEVLLKRERIPQREQRKRLREKEKDLALKQQTAGIHTHNGRVAAEICFTSLLPTLYTSYCSLSLSDRDDASARGAFGLSEVLDASIFFSHSANTAVLHHQRSRSKYASNPVLSIVCRLL